MNWDRFFFRLTIVVSVIPLFLGVLILMMLGNSDGVELAVIIGLIPFGLLWILYYAIRWIVHGLKEDD